MAIFPKIQSPCPYRENLAAIMDGETCRLCKRQVFDLTSMTDDGRLSFLADCAGEVCVSYRLRPGLAAAAMAAAVALIPTAAAAEDEAMEMIIVGGIANPAKAELVEIADPNLPELPVVYEDKPSPPTDARPATPVTRPRGS